VSPILVRPVREQLEHDRLIRHLLTKYKKKTNEVIANLGDEQVVPVKIGNVVLFPDLVISDAKKLTGLVEVETGESVNNLEAMAQWVHFSRGRVAFHLYVPVPAYDAAKRLCDAHQVSIGEIWTYRPLNEGFDLVRMSHDAHAANHGGRAATIVKLAPPKPIVEPPPPPPPPARPEAKPAAKGAAAGKPSAPVPPARAIASKGTPVKPAAVKAAPPKPAPPAKAPLVKAPPVKAPIVKPKPAPKVAVKAAAKKPAPKKPAPKPKAAARPGSSKAKSAKAGRRK